MAQAQSWSCVLNHRHKKTMYLKIKVTASLANQRVARSGENKGQVSHSVTVFGMSEDGIPAQFAITGLASASDSAAVAAKYPAGVELRGQVVPSDPFYIDQDRLQVIQPGK